MDYKELAEKLRYAKWTNPGITDEQSLEWDAADAITDLLSRAEAAEARAEKAEMERDAYKEMIYKARPCILCEKYDGSWKTECCKCAASTKEYNPGFKLKEE